MFFMKAYLYFGQIMKLSGEIDKNYYTLAHLQEVSLREKNKRRKNKIVNTVTSHLINKLKFQATAKINK